MIVQAMGYKKNGIMHCWDFHNRNKDEIETQLKEEGWTIVSIEELII
ncbi:hypothetical protein KDN24_05495 [Bacillus sp. Bva_UNVM-123]